MSWRVCLLVILVAAAAATTWLLVRNPSTDLADADAEELRAGYYLLDATIIGTNEFGDETYTLRARQIDHNPADDSVELDKLVLTYASDFQSGWTLDADRGHMPRAGNRIELSGNVVIAEKSDTAAATTITTTQLTVNIDAGTATTDEPVRMVVDNGFLTAEGMQADLENKQLSLLSNVHGEFLPTSAADD